MGVHVIELNALSTTGTVTLYFAIGAGLAFSDFQYVPGGAMSWASPTQKIDLSDQGMTSSAVDAGTIKIANMADMINSAGPLDSYLRGYGFNGQTARLWYCPDLVWAHKVLVDSGVLQQPVASGIMSAQLQDTVSFPLRDWRSIYTPVLQPTLYKGDGTPLEGTTTDLQSKPKPILYGSGQCIPAVLTSASLLIYQVCDQAAEVIAVYDGGVQISWDATYTGTTMAAFQAYSVPGGHYVVYSDNTYGTFVRLGTTPVKKMVVNAWETAGISPATAYSPYNNGHAEIWQRLSQARLGRSVSSASIAAFQALDDSCAGFWWGPNDTPTQKDALDQILGSCWGYEIYDPESAIWRIGKLVAADASASITLRVLQPSTRMASTDRKLMSASIVRPDWTPDGAPPSLVTINYNQTYDVHSDTDFNGSVDQPTRSLFSQQWRTVSAGTVNEIFINQPTVTVDTGYTGYTIDLGFPPGSPSVSAQAQTLFNLMQQYTGSFQVVFIPATYPAPDVVLPGDVVKMVVPRYGDPAHQNYRVLQSGLQVDENGPQMTLVAGLEN